MKEAGLVRLTDAGGEKLQNLYTPYSLRHFYASMLIAENKDLKTLQSPGPCGCGDDPRRLWTSHQRAAGEGARGGRRNSQPRSLQEQGKAEMPAAPTVH